MTQALPDEVERLALLGWRIYPASRKSRAACVSQEKDGAKPHELATDNLDQLEAWAERFPRCNWRVVMHGSGIVGLDVDAPGEDHAGDGIGALAALVAANSPLPRRPMTRSGGGGFALFFRDTGAPICKRSGYPVAGLDPRAGALTVTVPPSVHIRTGKPYRWVPGLTPWEVDPPEAPAWLLKALAPPPEPVQPPRREYPANDVMAERRLGDALQYVALAQDGTRNATLNRQAFAVGRYVGAGLLSEADATDRLARAAKQAGLHAIESLATIRSGIRSGKNKPVLVQV